MELVIVERLFNAQVSPEAVLADDAAAAWCFAQYRCAPAFHLLALDGRRICCVFRAPDAEALRQTARRLGMAPPDRVWTATLESPIGDVDGLRLAVAAADGSLVLVERAFATAVDFTAVQALEDRGAWCLDLHGVRFLASLFARDRQRMICLYAASDSEAVRRTNSRLDLPFERIWSARLVAPNAPVANTA